MSHLWARASYMAKTDKGWDSICLQQGGVRVGVNYTPREERVDNWEQ